MIEMEKIWVNISDVLFFQEGPGVRNTQYTTSGVKLLNVANLVDGKVDLSTSDRYISEGEAYGKYSHFLCDVGDFIVASSGIKVEYIDKKMGFIEESMLPLCMNTSTIRFKVLDEKQLRIRYFMYYLKSQHFKGQLAREITGSAQLNYGPSHLKKMVMPLVDISIQDEIVRQMDKVQKIIDMRQMELSHLDDLIKARFVELFGEYYMNHINEKQLDEICDFIDYRGKTPEKSESGIPLITAKNVKDNRFSIEPQEFIPEENYDDVMTRGIPRVNDVLFTTEAPLGNVCRIPDVYERFCVGQRLITMQPHTDVINSEYLEHALASAEFQEKMWQKSSGSTVKGIRSKLLVLLTIPVPPIELQNQFRDFVHQVDKSKFININIIPEGGFYNGDKFYIS